MEEKTVCTLPLHKGVPSYPGLGHTNSLFDSCIADLFSNYSFLPLSFSYLIETELIPPLPKFDLALE
ncbi:hypothetical protein K1719_044475 [Acacia pycnantha]|nr:hypothetical protein K1719_044475 [Acacia pycnantha]